MQKRKDLPIIQPPIETYQGSSFILVILLAHENTESDYYNYRATLIEFMRERIDQDNYLIFYRIDEYFLGHLG